MLGDPVRRCDQIQAASTIATTGCPFPAEIFARFLNNSAISTV